MHDLFHLSPNFVRLHFSRGVLNELAMVRTLFMCFLTEASAAASCPSDVSYDIRWQQIRVKGYDSGTVCLLLVDALHFSRGVLNELAMVRTLFMCFLTEASAASSCPSDVSYDIRWQQIRGKGYDSDTVCLLLVDGVTRLLTLNLPYLFEAGFFRTLSRTKRASSCLAEVRDNIDFFWTVSDDCSAHHAFHSSSLHMDLCSDLLSSMLALTV